MTISGLIERAAEAKRAGLLSEARRSLEEALTAAPGHPGALNALGLVTMDQGDAPGAAALFRQAVAADPAAAPLWLNLAHAQSLAGDAAGELASLDAALGIDPYLMPALLRKAQALERSGRTADSVQAYRAVLAATPADEGLPDAIRAALAHGRAVVAAAGERRAEEMTAAIDKLRGRFTASDFTRAQAYADHRAGRRQVYQQQPTGGHFPYLPAIEFFDRALFPWFAELEAASELIAGELRALLADADEEPGFAPYVAFDPTQPVNQWADLNLSPRWSAWFFVKDGVPQAANRAKCPGTAALLDRLPLLDIPGKGPTAMFSVLDARTRIPPHTGTSNVRTTVHLPLVIPPGCGFRVGSQTREWQWGEAWAFDDTIEHEAWNDSDQPRTILILDAWNPLLTEAERAVVRAIG
ncbi:aspartyl/asparaginyl beta-hydroxylase domain-containing protein [Qipengyuania sediminis]|uniref:aspartyl/asparaginyl beta-hydroxylase domain-containing protein n=1 Tax=Qipengyuania sediminis TaxID=1532023 RepID=UPI0014050E7A|nr:aspartyl/asparaginyl beta-hydroxylase domain-containing protein [Qipengyuania sediminis]